MQLNKYKIDSSNGFQLSNYQTSPPDESQEKNELKDQLNADIQDISKLQEMFFAHDKHSILLVFQAMDAAGKDGAIKHVMSGINPQGCQVFGFKAPSAEEYKNHFLLRHQKTMPQRGRIGIHNRSHYEFVLACKVNPEFILKEQLPKVQSIKDINAKFWKNRYRQIVDFEQQLAENGTIILKFFLYVSKKEQKKRLLERIENLDKNWKFEMGDLKARSQWDAYMAAYQEAIKETATPLAPWFIVPADDKWFARALIARILKDTLSNLDMRYPKLSNEETAQLQTAREILLAD